MREKDGMTFKHGNTYNSWEKRERDKREKERKGEKGREKDVQGQLLSIWI